MASLVAFGDRLVYKRIGLFVENPACEGRGFSFFDGDDDVAVKRPSMLAIVLTGFCRMVGVAVIETKHQFSFVAGFLFDAGQLERVELKAMIALGRVERIGQGTKAMDQA